jgi:sugar/nucleoside kinase (ribokinase family)
VSADLACGELAFVDLTFAGLEAVPAPGEERHARDFLRSPGGAATTAIGAARLGLDTALASPIGADEEGDFLRAALAREGVRWAGRKVARTAVTAVLPAGGERAMATYDPGAEVTAQELDAIGPRAVVLGLPRARLAPAGARLYVTAGDADARSGHDLAGLDDARALLVNAREAALLSGGRSPADAARALAEHVACAVVTRGAEGAVAASGGDVVAVPGPAVEGVDTTGAGDLFCAAFVWADLDDLALEERLRWAVLYASLSVGVPTATAGAATLDQLVREGERHGLSAPARAGSMSMTRRNP